MIRIRNACCTTPSAAFFWGAMVLLFYGTGWLLWAVWPASRPFANTTILAALSAACLVNFARNRTLHCGLTAPLFLIGAVAAALAEAGMWDIDVHALWCAVFVGVVLAFIIEWRTVGRRQGESSG